jgi:hypothetical protein
MRRLHKSAKKPASREIAPGMRINFRDSIRAIARLGFYPEGHRTSCGLAIQHRCCVAA